VFNHGPVQSSWKKTGRGAEVAGKEEVGVEVQEREDKEEGQR